MSNREAEFAAWWAAGHAVGRDWRTADGQVARVLFAGRPGGPAGPDFRDAVILLDGARLVGDVELHLRAAGWHAHGHDRDPRYDRVILHAVAGGPLPLSGVTTLASGLAAPIAHMANWHAVTAADPPPLWPCQGQAFRWEPALRRWGAERFARQAARFHAALAAPGATLDGVMLAGISEALGYGRVDAARAVARDQLTARRLQMVGAALARWDVAVGARCCGALLAGGADGGWERLVALFAVVGRARAGIVVWNVVLPCLAAHGDLCYNRALSRFARLVAATAPGLSSNAITRAMGRWLGLRKAPGGALAQQGLHHLHAQWCRVKDCATCPAARR